MNLPGDYDDVDMGGLPSGFYANDVPVEAQKTLIAAFPELRILWNAKLKEFQVVHRQPGWREGFYGIEGLGMLVGWSIIPWTGTPPLVVGDLIDKLRATEAIAQEKAKKYGVSNVAELADKIYDNWLANARAQEAAEMDEVLGLRPDGTVSPFGLASGGTIAKPYGWRGVGRPDNQLPRAPEWLTQHAVPVARGPGKKELQKRAKRLREGAPA